MSVLEKLNEFKIAIGFTVVVAGAITGAIAWAEDQKTLIRAEQQLIHSEMYQQSRIVRKRDQIKEHQRELKYLLAIIGDDEPTPRQAREIRLLDDEIADLRKEIEEIEAEFDG